MATITKASLLPFYTKLAADCRRDLKTLKADHPARPAIEGNLRMADTWIKFLSDPDVPEQNDPKFKQKMRKLETKDEVKRGTNKSRRASSR